MSKEFDKVLIMGKFERGVIFIPLVIAILIVGGGLIGVYTIVTGQFPKLNLKKTIVTPTPTPVRNPFPTSTPGSVSPPPEAPRTVEDDGGPITTQNATGKWVGRWTVNSPEACKGEGGEWTANLVESGGKLSGSFQYEGGGGNVSGTSASWSVGGGGGAVSFRGSISGNTISGTFTGEICDPEEAPQKTSGSFFGGRIGNP